MQVVGIPIADAHVPYLEKVAARLREQGIRVEVDASDDRMQKKIRTAQRQKVPFMLIAGDDDVAAGAVSFRYRDGVAEERRPGGGRDRRDRHRRARPRPGVGPCPTPTRTESSRESPTPSAGCGRRTGWPTSRARTSRQARARTRAARSDRAPKLSDDEGLIVARGELVYAVLNLYPYNAGHVLICPYRHVADYTDLTQAETAEFSEFTKRAVGALRQASGAQGFNIGINLGSVAGAGIAAHLHQHVVPRWGGDTNFMPVIGHTRVLPQLLADTRKLLADAWPA